MPRFLKHKRKRWDSAWAQGELRALANTRKLASEWYVEHFIPGHRWLHRFIGISWVAGVILALIATACLAAGYVDPGLMRLGNSIETFAFWPALGFAILLILGDLRIQNNRRRKCSTDDIIQERSEDIQLLKALGGWNSPLLRTECSDTHARAPSLWQLIAPVGVLASAFKFGDQFNAAVAWQALSFFVLLYLLIGARNYFRMRYQSRRPNQYSPCDYLPLFYFAKLATKTRDKQPRLMARMDRYIMGARHFDMDWICERNDRALCHWRLRQLRWLGPLGVRWIFWRRSRTQKMR